MYLELLGLTLITPHIPHYLPSSSLYSDGPLALLIFQLFMKICYNFILNALKKYITLNNALRYVS